jgi:hypothetical protein
MITIFLDIDGVLTTIAESLAYQKEFWDSNPLAKNEKIPYPFNEKCVDVLNEILKQFECEIVLTSDWKKRHNLKEIDIIFKNFGVIQSPIKVTENLRDEFNFEYCRAMEIMHFIGENAIKNYIIIDDLDLEKMFPPIVLDRFFKTSFDNGLAEPGLKDEIIKKMKLF